VQGPRTVRKTVEDEEPRRRQWQVWVVVTAVVAGLVWYFTMGHGNVAQSVESATAAQPAAMRMPAVAETAAPAAPSPTASAPVAGPGASEGPEDMVKQLETAMQGQSAETQSAFYADPVDRYLLRDKLSRAAVTADKQAAIEARREGWTETLDRVQVERKSDSLVNVRLVKHFKVKPDGRSVSEWFIPALLQLKREEGHWRIVSERDLGWVTTMDDWDSE